MKTFVIPAALLEELIAENERLHKAAYTDKLTTLYNRAKLELDIQLAVENQYEHGFAYILFDADGLKEANDKFGHAAGDALLQNISQLLRQNTNRETDSVYRLGGDEFVVLIRNCQADKIPNIIDRIQKGIEVGGYAASGGGAHSAEPDFINLADSRMYNQKKIRKAGKGLLPR